MLYLAVKSLRLVQIKEAEPGGKGQPLAMALTLSIPSELIEIHHLTDLLCLALSSATNGQYCSFELCSYPTNHIGPVAYPAPV